MIGQGQNGHQPAGAEPLDASEGDQPAAMLLQLRPARAETG